MSLKRDEFFKDPHQLTEHLRRWEGMLLDDRQDTRLALRVDESVAPAMFRPDPLIPGGYVANSLTLRAVRQDIFVAGDDLDSLAVERPCQRCNHPLDHQFWKLCPYCGQELSV